MPLFFFFIISNFKILNNINIKLKIIKVINCKSENFKLHSYKIIKVQILNFIYVLIKFNILQDIVIYLKHNDDVIIL